MQKNILITGKPGSGKSTLLKKIVGAIPQKVGLVTSEILEDGKRVGFEIETHEKHRAVLAHVNFKTPVKLSDRSKFFIDINNLEALIPEVSEFHADDFVYLDEIGQMQLLSHQFQQLVTRYLDSENTCLATLSSVFEDDFIKSIKERNDVIIVEITAETREETEKFIVQLLRKIEKAKRYISEPHCFIRKGPDIELESEHGTRTLSFINDQWMCDCDFFKEHKICSHTIAVQEFSSSHSLLHSNPTL